MDNKRLCFVRLAHTQRPISVIWYEMMETIKLFGSFVFSLKIAEAHGILFDRYEVEL